MPPLSLHRSLHRFVGPRTALLAPALALFLASPAAAQTFELDFDNQWAPGIQKVLSGGPAAGEVWEIGIPDPGVADHPDAVGFRLWCAFAPGVHSWGRYEFLNVDMTPVDHVILDLARVTENFCGVGQFDTLHLEVDGLEYACAPCCGTDLEWFVDTSALTGVHDVAFVFDTVDGSVNTGYFVSLDHIAFRPKDCDGDGMPDADEILADPGLDLNGDGDLDACSAPTYCQSFPNSSGQAARISAVGSPLVADADLTLLADRCPPGQFSYFLTATGENFVPGFGGSQGVLCLALPIYRFNDVAGGQLAPIDPQGERTLPLDFGNLPAGVQFQPGQTWRFQLWFRDQNPGLTSNTTNGLEVLFR